MTWTLYFSVHVAARSGAEAAAGLSAHARAEIDRMRAHRYLGQPFVLDVHGRPDRLLNAFFAARNFKNYAEGTRKKYALSIAMWLNFCSTRDLRWNNAGPDDVSDYKFWRMTDPANPARVGGSAMHGDVAAITALYRWAGPRHGITNPVERRDVLGRPMWCDSPRPAAMEPLSVAAVEPAGVRDRNVKWLDPAAVQRWIDVALRGFDLQGLELAQSRNRTGPRDAAFAHLLYGTGLRIGEGASLLVTDLPDDGDPGRVYFTGRLAAGCAKGHYSRTWWMPRPALGEVLSYVEGQRAEAVSRAQRAGRYDGMADSRILEGVHSSRRLALRGPRGLELVPLDGLDPSHRLRLLRETERGLEPVALWLNENGLPRPAAAWQATFRTGNERVARAGIPWFQCTAHMLRHSFALRWYSVGRLLWDRRLAHLTDDEQRDFRVQFGDTWQFVQTLLGHRHPQTTVDIYLEPFKSLEVELLMECAAQVPLSGLMQSIFQSDGRVLHDPGTAS